MVRKWVPTSRNPIELERQITAAVAAGRLAAETEPRAEAACYHPRTGRVEVQLRGGLSFAFPADRYPQLANLPAEHIAVVRVTASGYGLHWDEADVQLAVPQVVADLFGSWSAQSSGREGGKSRSPAKREAARKNALHGGRPATQREARRHGQVMHVEARAGAKSRSVAIHIGAQYVIEPMNPAARRHRGRTGRVIDFGDTKDPRIQLRFDDTGRIALVDPADLVPLQHQSSAA